MYFCKGKRCHLLYKGRTQGGGTNMTEGSFLRLLMKQKGMVRMKFGADFFKILNLVIQIKRLFARVFGDDADKDAASDSEARTMNDNRNEAC